jgi:hypothetical protein
MYVIRVIHSDRHNSQFVSEEEGEALARYITEVSIQAKVRAVSAGVTNVYMFKQQFETELHMRGTVIDTQINREGI